MATGSYMTPIYSRSQSEVQGDHHKDVDEAVLKWIHRMRDKKCSYLSTFRNRENSPICEDLISYGWTVALQWVPSHVGISSAMTDPAKAGSRVVSTGSPLDAQESIISTHIDKYNTMTQKPRALETVATVEPIPRHLERAEAVARFRLTIGQDFLGVYLH
ncbi:reverse transcriptase [Trichonephila clavipes]|nr:reverse transcriptase [Trichonephila clavipes]